MQAILNMCIVATLVIVWLYGGELSSKRPLQRRAKPRQRPEITLITGFHMGSRGTRFAFRFEVGMVPA